MRDATHIDKFYVKVFAGPMSTDHTISTFFSAAFTLKYYWLRINGRVTKYDKAINEKIKCVMVPIDLCVSA